MKLLRFALAKLILEEVHGPIDFVNIFMIRKFVFLDRFRF